MELSPNKNHFMIGRCYGEKTPPSFYGLEDTRYITYDMCGGRALVNFGAIERTPFMNKCNTFFIFWHSKGPCMVVFVLSV